jgi:hypothetical protein
MAFDMPERGACGATTSTLPNFAAIFISSDKPRDCMPSSLLITIVFRSIFFSIYINNYRLT